MSDKEQTNPGLGDQEQAQDPSHQEGHYEHWEHGKVEPKGTPIHGTEGFKGEKKLKLRAKELVHFAGNDYQPDEVFEAPEREALNLVGLGAVEELPGDAPPAQHGKPPAAQHKAPKK